MSSERFIAGYKAEASKKLQSIKTISVNKVPNFIIGGTNKAGTTSVFRYLSEHPQVCGSDVKETGFFVNNHFDNVEQAITELSKHFTHCTSGQSVTMEASTSYLALANEVIPRIKQVLGEPKVMFILRNPCERLYSYFNFHKGHLSIPESISFEQYIELCMLYEEGNIDVDSIPFDEWHLKAPMYGKYSQYLKLYIEHFPKNNVLALFFDDLKDNPKEFMFRVSEFIHITPSFYDTYEFEKANVTFFSRSRLLHKLAIVINRRMERLLRQRPMLKSRLVSTYKKINMSKHGYASMMPETEKKLKKYYAKSQAELSSLINQPIPPSWTYSK